MTFWWETRVRDLFVIVTKTYTHFLHVFLLLFVYALVFDSTEVYGTPIFGTTLIVFAVGSISAVCVGLCVVFYYAYHPLLPGE
eukprot:gene6950-8292_t